MLVPPPAAAAPLRLRLRLLTLRLSHDPWDDVFDALLPMDRMMEVPSTAPREEGPPSPK